jgi:predicted ATPase/signal transduction histidine kinase/tRNA A-37 threonylcarbamoyl transferase component Bud32
MAGIEVVEQIHSGVRSIVYRGRRKTDGRRVVVKTPRDELPSAETIARFKREYELARVASGQGAVVVEGLEPVEGSWALVMEDLGAQALNAVLAERRLGFGEALRLAASAASALSDLHAARVVHRDVNPSNILVVPGTAAARFIDFGLASLLPREAPIFRSASLIEGTLPYISPEQTGRMNRAVDSRADLYSLGVVLYELFTGRLPFESQDPNELVHMHVAQRPMPPRDLVPAVPRPISEMITRLLAKTPEERYQSAAGLAADLETLVAVLDAPTTSGAAPNLDEFTPGLQDVPDRFEVPQKLYGRDVERSRLVGAFESVARGRAESVFVGGPSGVGKTSLVYEIHKPIVARRGYFVAGKCDQIHRDKPCAPLIQAFRDLVRQLLAESESRFAYWRERLRAALLDNAQIIADVVPEVTLIIGPQPSAPPLPPAEAQTRLHHLFQRFVRVFAAEAHPLAIFLDDLQWADMASLRLLESLLGDPSLRHFLLIGSYRSNEVDAAHPLRVSIETLLRAGAPVTNLVLSPLGVGHVEQLLADALHCDPEHSAPLAHLLHERTGGNPFFLNQLLRRLHEEGLIEFDPSNTRWGWSLEAIRARGVTADVAELMATKLQLLPRPTQDALELAACVGSRFDLATLAIIGERTPRELARDLHPAIEAGLVLPRDDGWVLAQEGGAADAEYSFLHDRVQQAAHALIPADARAGLHFRIGHLLRTSAPDDERTFDVADHLNLGLAAASTPNDRLDVARANLAAGRKARAAAAFEPAMRYFDGGFALVDPSTWSEHYDLAAGLARGAMEAAFVNGRIDRGEEISTQVLARVRTVVERVEVHEVRASSAMQRRDLARAEAEGYAALNLLGLDLPKDMDLGGFSAVLAATGVSVGERRPADLLALPPMSDPRWLAASRVIMMLVPPTYMRNPLLCLALQLEGVRLCLEQGNSPEGSYFYAGFGVTQAIFAGRFVDAADYAVLASSLLDRLEATRLRAKVLLVNAAFVVHWTSHLRDVLSLLAQSMKAGLEVGDLEYMAYAASHIAMNLLYAGEPLDAALTEHARHLDLLTRWGLQNSAEVVRIVHQASVCLMGRAEDPLVVRGEAFDETVELASIAAAKNYSSVSLVHVMKAMLAVVFRSPDALAIAEAGQAWLAAQIGQQSEVVHTFYLSLARLGACGAPGPETDARLEQVAASQEKMRRWADAAPMNLEHRWQLVEAERARVRGEGQAAERLYESASQAALRHGYLQDVALAHELAAEHYLASGRMRLARSALIDAANAYRRWGAEAKVTDLARRHPTAFDPTALPAPEESGVSGSVERDVGTMDLAAVLKAAQAISSEILLDRLLDRLMGILIENAGARRGVLVMNRDRALAVQAVRSVDDEPPPSLPAPITRGDLVSEAVVSYVARTGESIVISDARTDARFMTDPYVAFRRPRSVLCTPLVNQGKLLAVVYLEHDLAPGVFTANRIEIVGLLSAQAALSLHNASLYSTLDEYNRTLEQKVEARTGELTQKNAQLAQALKRLRETQKQLVTQENLASLGALTAGIAHELKNPLNFINNFSELSVGLADELRELLRGLPTTNDDDLTDLLETIKANVTKVNAHGRRASQIIDGMLLHARSTTSERVATDLNALLAESVNLAYHGMRSKIPDFQLTIDAEYDRTIGAVEVASSELSRVFINVINNSCYAVEEKRRVRGHAFAPRLVVRTADRGERVEILIRDNGTGIPESVLGRIFTPFFTTKPPGDGTGLGLSISHDIVVGQHQGDIRFRTVEGEFAEAIIELPKRSTSLLA